MTPDIENIVALFEDSQALPIYSTDNINIKMKMSMKYGWKNVDREYSKKPTGRYHFGLHKSHKDWPRVKPGLQQ
jgi:hypothetical protein